MTTSKIINAASAPTGPAAASKASSLATLMAKAKMSPNTVGAIANQTTLNPQPVYTNNTFGNLNGAYTNVSQGAAASFSNHTLQFHRPGSLMVIIDSNNKDVVTLNDDGSVTWNNPDADKNEVSKAFADVLMLSSEQKANINRRVKEMMRDVMFQEMISLAEEKGTLTATELTYLWKSAKIMDKLKGI